MSTPNPGEKPKRPTRADIEERATLLVQIEAERKALRTKQKRVAAIEAAVADWLRHADPENRGRKLHGLRFFFSKKSKGVRWADAFLEACGVDRATELKQAAPEVDVLECERAG